jgi:hypothetical protein
MNINTGDIWQHFIIGHLPVDERAKALPETLKNNLIVFKILKFKNR